MQKRRGRRRFTAVAHCASSARIPPPSNNINYLDNRITNVDNRVTNLDNRAVKYDINNDGTVNYNSVTLGGDKSTGPVSVHNVADGVAPTDAVNKRQLDGLGKRADGGTAAAMAMMNVTAVEPGKSHVNVALSNYNGQTGFGVGWLKRSINGQWTASAAIAGATGGAKVGVRIGAGFTY